MVLTTEEEEVENFGGTTPTSGVTGSGADLGSFL